jgi:hypothetical protein
MPSILVRYSSVNAAGARNEHERVPGKRVGGHATPRNLYSREADREAKKN